MRKIYEADDESGGDDVNEVFEDNDVDDVDDKHKNTDDPDDRNDEEVDRLRGKDNGNEDASPFETDVMYSPSDRKKVDARVTKTSDGLCIEIEQQQPRPGYVRTLFMHIATNDIGVKRFEVIESELECEGSSAAEKLHVRFSDIQDAIDYVRSRSTCISTASVDNVSHADFSTSVTLSDKRKRKHSQIDQKDVKSSHKTSSRGSAGNTQERHCKDQRTMSVR